MNWLELAEQKRTEMIEELQKLIQIPSVLDEKAATEEMPFGPKPLEALNHMLSEGKNEGLVTKNIDNMAGHIEMGDGEETLGILCHVDVVPVGEGWTYPPFEGVVADDKIYGRGAIDDKGPTIAAWMAMKLVKESGIPLHKKVRLIIGTDEESGFRCVERYFEKEPMPEIGFAPDADFPIINAEKGIANLIFTQTGSTETETIQFFQAGKRTNMVPDEAFALIFGGLHSIKQKFSEFSTEHGFNGEVTQEGPMVKVLVRGKSAHAMEPDEGVNAAILLAKFLQVVPLTPHSKAFVDFLVIGFGDDSRGHALSLNFSDDVSGDTTLNPGVIHYAPAQGSCTQVSMRYSVTYPFEEKLSTCRETLQNLGITLDLGSNSKPHYVDKEDILIKSLQKVYERQTGEEAKLLSIGGGTYARVLKNGVAFGMLFPGRKDVAHQVDEYVDIEDLVKATAIYADAIVELAGKNTTEVKIDD
ncbi:dipeptidase PepV [Psychrobacillus sp. FJAT-21963]|uniref:dipeptidase PepV n=1 Tax=unclassified Psychrobacillus TaxID=2636677 RepID=UPI0006F8DC47|nr:dipeptidase PepV [Psychrobacillus sp. FJAT-21963]KQL32562.1 diguanylate cyclase [Psychrobacillus sp. FJAT-21963]